MSLADDLAKLQEFNARVGASNAAAKKAAEAAAEQAAFDAAKLDLTRQVQLENLRRTLLPTLIPDPSLPAVGAELLPGAVAAAVGTLPPLPLSPLDDEWLTGEVDTGIRYELPDATDSYSNAGQPQKGADDAGGKPRRKTARRKKTRKKTSGKKDRKGRGKKPVAKARKKAPKKRPRKKRTA